MNFINTLVFICALFGAVAMFIAIRNRHEDADTTPNSTGETEVKRPQRSTEERWRIIHAGKGRCLPALAFLFLSAGSSALYAQEVVHARAGQLIAINTAAKTLTLQASDGTVRTFQEAPLPEPLLSFDKDVKAKTVPVASFKNVGSHVIVFYYGFDNTRTAIAIKDLGIESITRANGSISHLDGHHRTLLFRTSKGVMQSFNLSDDMLVDTSNGVVFAAKYHPDSSEQVAIVSRNVSGAPTALFANTNY